MSKETPVVDGKKTWGKSLESDVRQIFQREEDILKKRIMALEVEKVAPTLT